MKKDIRKINGILLGIKFGDEQAVDVVMMENHTMTFYVCECRIDHDDGWRSYTRPRIYKPSSNEVKKLLKECDVNVTSYPLDIVVETDKDYELTVIEVGSEKPFLSVSTDFTDSWYPYGHIVYHPEFLSLNSNIN